jgi:hypothetical protein
MIEDWAKPGTKLGVTVGGLLETRGRHLEELPLAVANARIVES